MRYVIFISVLLIAAASVGCSTPAPRTSEQLAQSDLIITDIQSAPIEYKLAFLDSGHLPKGNDVNAARIRYLLKSLAERTDESPQSIADRTSAATDTLKGKYGRAVTHQQFLEQAHDYSGPKTSYSDMAGLLTIMMGR